jgi:hypothetical protein
MPDKITKSTGPVTPAGKIRSAQNSTKHGLRSAVLILNDDEQKQYDQLYSSFKSEIMPSGVVETFNFEKLVRAAWMLRRAENKIAELGADGIDPFEDEAALNKLELYERYRTRYEASYYRAIRELRIEQTTRLLQMALPAPLNESALPVLANPTQIVQLAKRTAKGWENQAITQFVDQNGAPIHDPDAKTDRPVRFEDFLKDSEKPKFDPKPPRAA